MLTLDDLDHFNNPGFAQLFAPSRRDGDAETVARRARILACLNFCRDIPDADLAGGGLHAARRVIKSVLRSLQRKHWSDADELTDALASVQRALGERVSHGREPIAAQPERHAIEAEIQSAASKLAAIETSDPLLLESLASGDFEILPGSDLASLTAVIGKFGGTAEIDLDLLVDSDTTTQRVRIHLAIETGFWSWAAQGGGWLSRDGAVEVVLSPDDGVVQALLCGLALRSGRTIAAWAEKVFQHKVQAANQTA